MSFFVDDPPLLNASSSSSQSHPSSMSSRLLKDLDIVSTLHHKEQDSPFLSNSKSAIQNILAVFVLISLSFLIFLVVLQRASSNINKNDSNHTQSKKYTNAKTTNTTNTTNTNTTTTKTIITPKKRLEIAYQATNLCVNLTLGLYGIYHYNLTLPNKDSLPVTDRIIGFNHYYMFASSQIGYNLWSIPVGYFLMNETTIMLAHHIAVMIVSLTSGMATAGFRYHSVFFFGLIEISSVPLALMNFCKNNPELAKTYCPRMRGMIRPMFAATFLTTRVLMWTPNIMDVLRGLCLLLWTSTSWFHSVMFVLFTTSVVYLTLLQYFWGYKIMKGIAEQFQRVKTL